MKNRIKILAVLTMFLAAAGLTFGNGLNLNSLGARALAMGGAYIGLANDLSAIYWNPAGLAFFKSKTFGFYGSDIIPSGTYSLTLPTPIASALGVSPTVVDARTTTKHYLSGMFAYVHPISDRLVAAFGIYQPAGLGAAWDSADLAFISNGRQDIEWSSKVGLITFAPTLAYRASDKLSFGAQLNVNYGIFNVSTYSGSAAIPIPPYSIDLGQYTEHETGWSVGATLSALFKPSEKLSLGLAVRTPTKTRFSGEAEMTALSLLGFSSTSDVEREIRWPLWVGAGLAVKPIPKLTVTADLQYTDWQVIDVIPAEYTDPIWVQLMTAAGKTEMPMHWESRLQIRFGAEYALNETLALRAGYYNDPAPAPDRTMNILLPNYDFNVFTLGVGYSLGALQLDFGLEYLLGASREISVLKTFTNPAIPNPAYDPDYADAMPGKYGMKILAPAVMITYRF
jgi:long-chain fatty acid transport protein